jgi:hypothetical protein
MAAQLIRNSIGVKLCEFVVNFGTTGLASVYVMSALVASAELAKRVFQEHIIMYTS